MRRWGERVKCREEEKEVMFEEKQVKEDIKRTQGTLEGGKK